ncbi:MAG: glycosyltransferase [Flavobacteriales bacterium]
MDRRSSPSNTSDTLRIAVVLPSPDIFRETFITEHVQRLPRVVLVMVDGNLPRRLSTGERFMRSSVIGRGVDLLQAMLLMTDQVGLHQRRIAQRLRRAGVNVVLAEYGNTADAMIASCLRANVPLVAHFHGFDAHRTDILERFHHYRRLFDHAASIVAVSRAMEHHLVDIGAPRDKVVLNCCGVDTERFRGGAPENAPPHFISIGRFVEKKAPQLVLAAFRLVVEQRPQARLTMVGDGPLRESCIQLVKDQGMTGQVDLVGVRSSMEISALLRGARGFVQHSVRAANGDSEGTPVSVLEAMASGVPVVATRHAGIMDVVKHEECGLLSEEHDVRTMADHLIRLVDDPALAGRLGRAGRTFVEEHHRVQDSIATLHHILERAAARSR